MLVVYNIQGWEKGRSTSSITVTEMSSLSIFFGSININILIVNLYFRPFKMILLGQAG